MLSTPRSTSSSSRTTRVIEELQENLESIHKELETTKIQVKHNIISFILETKKKGKLIIIIYIFAA